MLKTNIQHFAESAEGTDADNGGNNTQGGGNSPKTFTQEDVDRIVNERTERAAKAAMKSFFTQKGLSEEEAAQAMDSYLAEKQKNNPEAINAALQKQLADAQSLLIAEKISREAEKAARKLGADESAIDYVVKLADTASAVENGEISAEKIAEAVKKVMDDVPAFKKQTGGAQGVKIGGDNDGGGSDNSADRIRAAFGIINKRKD